MDWNDLTDEDVKLIEKVDKHTKKKVNEALFSQAVLMFRELESKRITDNVDYISIPMDKWEEIKTKYTEKK